MRKGASGSAEIPGRIMGISMVGKTGGRVLLSRFQVTAGRLLKVLFYPLSGKA